MASKKCWRRSFFEDVCLEGLLGVGRIILRWKLENCSEEGTWLELFYYRVQWGGSVKSPHQLTG
jgi:hypothetical protein